MIRLYTYCNWQLIDHKLIQTSNQKADLKYVSLNNVSVTIDRVGAVLIVV